MQLTDEQREAIVLLATKHIGDKQVREQTEHEMRALLVAHSAGAQEPVGYTTADRLKRIAERHRHVDTMWPASMRDEGDIPLYTHPQPIPQTDAARDAEDAKRYRFIRSKMQVGAVQTQLPLYRTLHWIGYEDCSDVRNADAAIDAEIERLDGAKGE